MKTGKTILNNQSIGCNQRNIYIIKFEEQPPVLICKPGQKGEKHLLT